MKTTKLFALVLSLFLLAIPLTSCTLGADGDLAARLDSMEALISQQNATIEGLNAKLADQSSTISGLNAKLGEQSSTIAGQNTIINGLNTQIFEQNTDIGDLNSKLSEQTTIIAGQNATIDGLNTQLTEQNATVEDLNATLTEQSMTIDALNTQLATQSSTIESLSTQLYTQDVVISNLESQVSELQEVQSNSETILLTNQNYNTYLSFNVTFDELQRIDNPDALLYSDRAVYVCRMTITTHASRPNMIFKYASIRYDFDASNMLTIASTVWTSTGSKWCNQKVELASDGFSQATFYIECTAAITDDDGKVMLDGNGNFYTRVPPLPNTTFNIPVFLAVGSVTIKY